MKTMLTILSVLCYARAPRAPPCIRRQRDTFRKRADEPG